MDWEAKAEVACHNCRRRRLRCDRSQPACQKCQKRGHDCLGYGQLLRWEKGIASRGLMAGKTYSIVTPKQKTVWEPSCSLYHLKDPLVQDLDDKTRMYLSHFADHVCKDLVLYDSPCQNPFRSLLSMISHSPLLLYIIVASDALHQCNARESVLRLRSSTSSPSLVSRAEVDCGEPGARNHESYMDALVAKEKALVSLRAALRSKTTVDHDIVLASVLLFIELELIDSGRNEWKHHVQGARALVSAICNLNVTTNPSSTMTPLRRSLVANCLVFDIVGSTLTPPTGFIGDQLSTGALCLLEDVEGNHCSSMPTFLLQLMHAGARLLQLSRSTDGVGQAVDLSCILQQAMQLLESASSFDAVVWAKQVQQRSPSADLEQRTQVALAHRAAALTYLSSLARNLDPGVILPSEPAVLVKDVVKHLKSVDVKGALFTATPWSAFIAGAEAVDLETQEWIADWFALLWTVEPWGLIREALGLLQSIWAERRKGFTSGRSSKGHGWINDLGDRGMHWLIL